MDTRPGYLVVIDFPAIKKFVFGTDRLVEIRGASALLDSLNRDFTTKTFTSRYGTTKYRCVFAGGGAGQFVIEDSLDNIHEAVHEIGEQIYVSSGGGLSLSYGAASLNEGYLPALQHAFVDLERRKREQGNMTTPLIHSGYFRDCDSCSGTAAHKTSYAEDTRFLCETCFQKQDMGQKRGLWDDFAVYLTMNNLIAEQPELLRPRDVEEIGDRCLSKKGYTALVYGDGNGMGNIVKKIGTEEQFRCFSNAVDQAIKEACYESLWETCKTVSGKIPADILLLGGDDIIIYLAADKAMSVATQIAKLFERKTHEKLTSTNNESFFTNLLGNQGLTLSFGIAYGKYNTPISIMVDQAEELLTKSAKRKDQSSSNETVHVPTYIDFHMTSSYNHTSVLNCRQDRLELKSSHNEDILLYGGPYTLQESELLLEQAKCLRDSGIPSTRLRRFQRAPFQGKVQGTIETLETYVRCRSDAHKLAIMNAFANLGCLPVMPWRQKEKPITTPVIDLIHLVDFV